MEKTRHTSQGKIYIYNTQSSSEVNYTVQNYTKEVKNNFLDLRNDGGTCTTEPSSCIDDS